MGISSPSPETVTETAQEKGDYKLMWTTSDSHSIVGTVALLLKSRVAWMGIFIFAITAVVVYQSEYVRYLPTLGLVIFSVTAASFVFEDWMRFQYTTLMRHELSKRQVETIIGAVEAQLPALVDDRLAGLVEAQIDDILNTALNDQSDETNPTG